MRLAIAHGRVVLNTAVESLRGRRLILLEPVTAESLASGDYSNHGTPLVAVDPLGAGEGQLVGFVEGREAANPWWPESVPVDACCALLVDAVDYRPAPASEDNK